MRLGKIFSLISVVAFAFAFFACENTVSSTDASERNGYDLIPGFNPGKADSSKTSVNSSSSTDQPGSSAGESSASTEESSASEDQSSSSEVVVDFSESEIQVDGSNIAVILPKYLVAVNGDVESELNDLVDAAQYDSKKSPVNLAVDDFDYSKNRYFCFTEAEEWLEITQNGLLDTKLPFLWDMPFYEYRDRYALNFEETCASIYVVVSADLSGS